MAAINLDGLDGNSHFVVYYINKNYPRLVNKEDIATFTGLSVDTVYKKVKELRIFSLIQEKKIGRTPYYYIDEEAKRKLDTWYETDLGKGLLEKFEERNKVKNSTS